MGQDTTVPDKTRKNRWTVVPVNIQANRKDSLANGGRNLAATRIWITNFLRRQVRFPTFRSYTNRPSWPPKFSIIKMRPTSSQIPLKSIIASSFFVLRLYEISLKLWLFPFIKKLITPLKFRKTFPLPLLLTEAPSLTWVTLLLSSTIPLRPFFRNILHPAMPFSGTLPSTSLPI